MPSSVPVRYRDFWDVPRIFIVEHEGHNYLFSCPVDEATEDFGDQYHVYLLPKLEQSPLRGSWADLPAKAIQRLADVPISRVRWDPTRRKEIDIALLDELSAC